MAYKWVVLSNTTIGMLLATINSSIILSALPTSSAGSISTRGRTFVWPPIPRR